MSLIRGLRLLNGVLSGALSESTISTQLSNSTVKANCELALAQDAYVDAIADSPAIVTNLSKSGSFLPVLLNVKKVAARLLQDTSSTIYEYVRDVLARGTDATLKGALLTTSPGKILYNGLTNPVYDIYVGTNLYILGTKTGVLVSYDGDRFFTALSYSAVTNGVTITATSSTIFVMVNGTTTLHRFSTKGFYIDTVTLPASSNTEYIAETISGNGLSTLCYASAAGTVYVSTDEGASWVTSTGAGTCKVVVWVPELSLFCACGSNNFVRSATGLADSWTATSLTNGTNAATVFTISYGNATNLQVVMTGAFYLTINCTTWAAATVSAGGNSSKTAAQATGSSLYWLTVKTTLYGPTLTDTTSSASVTSTERWRKFGSKVYAVSTSSAAYSRLWNAYPVVNLSSTIAPDPYVPASETVAMGAFSHVSDDGRTIGYVGATGGLYRLANGVFDEVATTTAHSIGRTATRLLYTNSSTYYYVNFSSTDPEAILSHTPGSASAGTSSINHIFGNDSYVVVVGNTGNIYSASLSLALTSRTSNTTENLRFGYYKSSLDMFVVVGNAGVIRTSTGTASTWSSPTSNTSAALYVVTEFNELLVAAGDDVILTSPDGVTWTAITVTCKIRAAAAFGGYLYLIGNDSTYYMMDSNFQLLKKTVPHSPDNGAHFATVSAFATDTGVVAFSSNMNKGYLHL